MTLVVQFIIGRAAIIDSVRGRMYPVGPGFEFRPDAEHLKHREAYTFVQAQQVADWVNEIDRPLNIVARAVDPFDPLYRRNWNAARGDGQRRGLVPLLD